MLLTGRTAGDETNERSETRVSCSAAGAAPLNSALTLRSAHVYLVMNPRLIDADPGHKRLSVRKLPDRKPAQNADSAEIKTGGRAARQTHEYIMSIKVFEFINTP